MDANQLYVDAGFYSIDDDKLAYNTISNPRFGVETSFDISIQQGGKAVDGTIIWTSNDLDIVNRYDSSNNTYAESITITAGAESYAVVPHYDHLNRPSTTYRKNPLGVERVAGTTSDGTANNVRFYGIRDDYYSYDSGFGALVSSGKTSMVWTGSRVGRDQMGTVLFNNTASTRIEMTHGTGGGIYLESYKKKEAGDTECTPYMIENLASAGLYARPTVTVVPEDGYRVKDIYVGEAEPETAAQTKYTIYYDEDGNASYINDTDHKIVDGKVSFNLGEGKSLDFEINSDGTVDVTLPEVVTAKHVHADFDADYYFYKVWEGGTPQDLTMTVAPYEFVFAEVDLPEGKFTIENNSTFIGPDGTIYELDDVTDVLDINGTQYRLVGNDLISTDGTDTPYPIDLEYGINADTQKQTFVVTKADAENVEEPNVKQTTNADGKTVWKIKYPAAGYTTKEGKVWPALPIEDDPADHKSNHVNRNYWFVTEEEPAWAVASYDNSNAESMGIVSPGYRGEKEFNYSNATFDGSTSTWYAAATKDYEESEKKIKAASKDSKAFMSVFYKDDTGTNIKSDDAEDTWGGEITNVLGVVAKGTKTWEDQNDKYGNRTDIWMHIDAKYTDKETGEEVKIDDFLPAQEITKNAKGDALTVTWGDKKPYRSQEDNVVILGDVDDLPVRSGNKRVIYTRNDDGSIRGSNGITYWINELPSQTDKGETITYSIRETYVTVDGNETYGAYTSDPGSRVETTKSNTPTVIDGQNIDTYTAEITNTLVLEDITATKDWDDDNNRDGYREELKFTLGGIDGDLPNSQSKEKTIAKGASGTALTVEWTDLPKYVNGSPVLWTITENSLEHYENPIITSVTTPATDTEDEKVAFTVTNHHTPEVGNIKVTKTWDDANNQDGQRKEGAEVYLFKQVSGGSLQQVDDAAAVKVPTEDGEFIYWQNLPLREGGGKVITYSIKEDVVNLPGYTTTYSGNNVQLEANGTKTIAITNKRTPDVKNITVEKVWEDSNDKYNVRPSSIDVTFKTEYKLISATTKDVSPAPSDKVVTETTTTDKTVTRGTATYTVKKDENGVEYYEYNGPDGTADLTYHDPDDNKEIKPADKAFWPTADDEIVQEDGKVKVIKTVEVDGVKYDIMKDKNGVEYYVVPDENDDTVNHYYKADDTKTELTVETGTFEPDPHNDAFVKEEVDGKVNKTVTVDGATYVVKEDKNGVQYYEIDGKYYAASDNSELTIAEKKFNPQSTDETVQITTEGPKTVEVDGEKYTVKEDKDGVKYYEKDGKYYNPDDNSELKAVVEKTYPETKTEEETITLSGTNSWKETKSNLPVNAREGQAILYSVKESTVPGYTSVVEATEEKAQDGTVTVKYTITNVIKPPKATPDETTDWRGLSHDSENMNDHFTVDSSIPGPDGSANKIEKITLVDANGNETDEVKVPGEGTYKLNSDGTITFTPERNFVGKTSGVKVRGYDSNKLSADTTYTPTVIMKVEYVDPMNEDPEEVVDTDEAKKSDGSDVDTDYEGADKSKSKNHDGYRFDGWTEEEVEDTDGSIKLVRRASYTPMYNINYDANGGTGTMEDDDYAADDDSMPDKNNTFTRDGYKYLGFYAYITDPTTGKETLITDDDGNPIIFTSAQDMSKYFEGMPGGTSIRMEAQWEKEEDPTPTPPDPDPTPTPTPDPDPDPTPTPTPDPDPDPDPDPKPDPDPDPDPNPNPDPKPTPTPSPSKTPAGGTTTPTATPKTTSKTGDAAPIAPLAVVALAAIAGMGLSQRYRYGISATAKAGRHSSTGNSARVVHTARDVSASTPAARGKHVK